MVGILLLLLTIGANTSQSVINKQYTIKSGGTDKIYLYSAVLSFFSMCVFILSGVFGEGLDFSAFFTFLPYSVLFGAGYVMGTVFFVLAVANGPLALSSLIISYSLVIPTLYGIFGRHNSIAMTGYIGMALLVISLFLIREKKMDKKPTLKWLVYIILAFLGNGMCSTFQSMEQYNLDSKYGNEFMIVALSLVVLFFLIMTVVKGDVKSLARHAVPYGAAYGIANGVVNFLVILLQKGFIDTAILFPSISGCGVLAAFLLARFVYKETFTKEQILGYAAGFVSVVFLNL